MLKPTWKYNVAKQIAKTLNETQETAMQFVEQCQFTDYCYNRNYNVKSSAALIIKLLK
jgi:hypothetical protein